MVPVCCCPQRFRHAGLLFFWVGLIRFFLNFGHIEDLKGYHAYGLGPCHGDGKFRATLNLASATGDADADGRGSPENPYVTPKG
jgi:hypothetical protein